MRGDAGAAWTRFTIASFRSPIRLRSARTWSGAASARRCRPSCGRWARRCGRSAPGRAVLSNDEVAGFSTAVVSRLNAERDASMTARVRAAVRRHAPALRRPRRHGRRDCVRRADAGHDAVRRRSSPRLAGLDPDRHGDAVRMRGHQRGTGRGGLPRAMGRAFPARERDGGAGRGIHAGRDGDSRRPAGQPRRAARQQAPDASGQAEVIEELLDTVSRARSTADPTELSGSMVRFVAKETVRTARQPAIDLPLPPTKPSAMRKARARQVTA